MPVSRGVFRCRSFRVAVLIGGFCVAGFAQVERASITGTVSDASGAAVAGATVRVTDGATNNVVTLETDSAGECTARNLNPGSYGVEAEKSGFTKHVDRDFVVQVSQTARLDIKLSLGSSPLRKARI